MERCLVCDKTIPDDSWFRNTFVCSGICREEYLEMQREHGKRLDPPTAKEFIEWVEPFGPNNEPVFCRVPLETAIATQKFRANQAKPGFKYASDMAALDDFITVHWGNRIWVN